MFRSLKLSFVVAMVLAQGAYAADADPFRIVEGRADAVYGDLNLSNPADAQTMLDRLRHAARQSCGIMAERDPYYRSNRLFVATQFRKCQRQALHDAVAKLNRPLVTQAYASAYGLRLPGNAAVAEVKAENGR